MLVRPLPRGIPEIEKLVLTWLRRRRRRKILQSPFPPHWEELLATNVRGYSRLDDQRQAKLRRDTQILAAEKNWEGCGGIEMNDEIRITIAGMISRMTLGFTEEYFDMVASILVYPDAYVAKDDSMVVGGIPIEADSDRIGEAWYRGPVILSWNDILESIRHGKHNVVIHEFAHQLDMQNGRHADGIPPLAATDLARRWPPLMEREFQLLRRRCHQHLATVFDCYGASSISEFFAVACEAFFETPESMAESHPELFGIFREYFGHDPRI